jgi:hypothetical protein
MDIKLYYAPQTTYFVSNLISISAIILVASYLIFATAIKVRRSRATKVEQYDLAQKKK